MARTLNDSLLNLLQGSNYCTYSYSNTPLSEKKVFLTIPLNTEIIELPVLVLPKFQDAVWRTQINQYSSIAIALQDYGNAPYYSTLDRILRDTLIAPFKDSKLHKVEVKQGGETITYYVSRGAIFDDNYTPILMLSWELEKQNISEDNNIPYQLRRMIVRVSPDCYLNKTDPMRRAIANRIINLVLNDRDVTRWVTCDGLISRAHRKLKVVVEIANCPFNITHPKDPLPDTSNKEIASVALNHIEEIVNDS